jgi:hypothetical protein
MKSKNLASTIATLIVLAIAVCISGCGAASAPPPLPISVSVSPSTPQSVDSGQTASFTATVANDSSNKGVTWTVTCATAPCGTVSPTSTASGAATTYTAPSSVAANLNVSVTATSVADSTKSASGAVAVTAISVSVAPTSANLAVGATAQFTASVTNDGGNAGVNWTVSCSAAPCGRVAPVTTASGVATTYTAPSTPPAGNLAVTLTATSATDGSKSGSANISVTGITISIAPTSASVQSGGTQQFTASVSNDPSNGGVTWSLVKKVCNPLTRSCGYNSCSTCGTVSPTNTASGAPTTYTAPAELKVAGIFNGSYLQATSVTNNAAFSRAGLTILPVSVSVSPATASVAFNGTQQFTATVTNDATNSGVTWSLTQNGTACSPGCGTVSPASTASGAGATYTAPATAPVVPVVTVNATSVEDTTKSGSGTVSLTTSTGGLPCDAGSGSESLLKGQYTFLLQTFDPQGGLGIAGSVTADGAGRITAGEEDIERNSGGGEVPPTISTTASSYAVGPDHRGCLLLAGTDGQTTFLRFALGSISASSIATAGHVIEFDDTTGTGTRAAGTLRLQDPTSFKAGQFKGNYAFGVVGKTPPVGGFAMAGTFATDGVSVITSGNFDLNLGAGTVASNVSSNGNFTCCDANGRGTGLFNGTNPPANFVVYLINSGDAFLIVNNDVWGAAGEAFGVPSTTTFTQASLNGVAVLRETAQTAIGPIVDIATANANGTGTITVNDNINNAGTFTTSGSALNYVVASNGRVALSGGTTPPVLYLYGPNQGFLVGTDANVSFGILEPQAAGPFSKASFSGAYMLGTENPSARTVTLESGVVTADGKGNAAGISDQSSSAGLAQNQGLNFTYTFAADGTGNIGSGTTAILISGNKLVFINNASPNPTITVVEK